MRIIGAMLAGKLTYAEAQRLQAIKGNMDLTMAAKEKGVEI